MSWCERETIRLDWAYDRDASWHATGGSGRSAGVMHMPNPAEPVLAACSSRIVLFEESGAPATEVPAHRRCRRSGCTSRWPSDRRDGLNATQLGKLTALGYCGCDQSCMLLPSERARTRTICRYRHGSVKSIQQLNKAAADILIGGADA
jgi:hypothetical protein